MQLPEHGAEMYTRRYQIIVSGRLGIIGCEAFRDLRIDPHGADTVLTGDLSQSGLHDVFARLGDLALDLVGVTCLAPEPGIRRQVDAVRRQENASVP